MQDPGSPNPFAPGPENQTPGPVLGQGSPHSGGTGMFGALPVVSILLIVLGSLELLYALFMGGVMMFAAVVDEANGAEAAIFQVVVIGFCGGVGVVALLRIVAGVGGFKYRRWGVMMAACCAGVLTIFTCYCAPFSLVVGILGIVVLADSNVRRAFELAKDGRSPAEIRQIVTGR